MATSQFTLLFLVRGEANPVSREISSTIRSELSKAHTLSDQEVRWPFGHTAARLPRVVLLDNLRAGALSPEFHDSGLNPCTRSAAIGTFINLS